MELHQDHIRSCPDRQRGMGADHRPQQRVVPRVHEDDGRVDGVFTEGEFEVNEQNDRTISEEFEDIKMQMCEHYCKYPKQYQMEHEDSEAAFDLMISEICAECPLNRL